MPHSPFVSAGLAAQDLALNFGRRLPAPSHSYPAENSYPSSRHSPTRYGHDSPSRSHFPKHRHYLSHHSRPHTSNPTHLHSSSSHPDNHDYHDRHHQHLNHSRPSDPHPLKHSHPPNQHHHPHQHPKGPSLPHNKTYTTQLTHLSSLVSVRDSHTHLTEKDKQQLDDAIRRGRGVLYEHERGEGGRGKEEGH